jgi:hypothetical protein
VNCFYAAVSVPRRQQCLGKAKRILSTDNSLPNKIILFFSVKILLKIFKKKKPTTYSFSVFYIKEIKVVLFIKNKRL